MTLTQSWKIFRTESSGNEKTCEARFLPDWQLRSVAFAPPPKTCLLWILRTSWQMGQTRLAARSSSPIRASVSPSSGAGAAAAVPPAAAAAPPAPPATPGSSDEVAWSPGSRETGSSNAAGSCSGADSIAEALWPPEAERLLGGPSLVAASSLATLAARLGAAAAAAASSVAPTCSTKATRCLG